MSDLQHAVQAALDDLVESGTERGIQVAAYVDGQQVVDAVAGVADPVTGRVVEPDTVFYNFSIGKGAMATLVHQQVDAGALTYDTPVADVWPEFAAHGKQAVTVRHVLTHSAGVPGIPVDSTIEDICTWETMVRALEQAEPWWEPGTRVGYHAYTFGYLAGEIVRRVTGRPLGTVLREDLADPLGHPDEIFFGVPADKVHRLAVLEDAPSDGTWNPEDMPADLPMFRAGPMSLFPTAALGNDPRAVGADIPAGGKVSARAIAKMYAALLGEVDGVRLVSPGRLAGDRPGLRQRERVGAGLRPRPAPRGGGRHERVTGVRDGWYRRQLGGRRPGPRAGTGDHQERGQRRLRDGTTRGPARGRGQP